MAGQVGSAGSAVGGREPGARRGVSVALPVFNGEAFVEAAIRSILAQTHAELELVVLDNASTDGTEEICRELAARDERIAYHRNPETVGAAENFNRAFGLTSGAYVKWASHDDLLDPTYLARCVEVLDGERGVAVCHAQASVVDEHGAALPRTTRRPLPSVDEERASSRLATVLAQPGTYLYVWGLMRADVLGRTPLLRGRADADRTLVAELGLHGRLVCLPEPLFLLRHHPEQSTRVHRSIYERGAWFDPSRRGRPEFPHWWLVAEYLRSVREAPLPARERAACYGVLARWLALDWQLPRLGMDLLVALDPRFIRLYEAARRRFGRWRDEPAPETPDPSGP